MTTYHIDPEAGLDSNSGLSWALAWKTLGAIRSNSITLSPGDLVKLAKSVERTGQQLSSSISYITVSVSPNPSNTPCRHDIGTNINASWVAGVTFTSFFGTTPEAMTFASSTGAIEVVNRKLFYRSCSTANLSTYSDVYLLFKSTTLYSGAGDVHIPPNTFNLCFCSDTLGNTPVLTVPIDIWIRNSTSQASGFYYKGGASLPTNVGSISIWRTTNALNRTASLWGLSMSWATISIPWSSTIGFSFDMAIKDPGAAMAQSVYPGVRISPPGKFWVVDQDAWAYKTNQKTSQTTTLNTCIPSGAFMQTNFTGGYTVSRATYLKDFHMYGTSGWSASPSSSGLYDLNGSTGGTLASPIIFEGGYNTVSDTVDGQTIFIGAVGMESLADYYDGGAITGPALLDLQSAPHIHIKNIQIAKGILSYAANPGTHLKIENSFVSGFNYFVSGSGLSSCNLHLKYITQAGEGLLRLTSLWSLTLENCNFFVPNANVLGITFPRALEMETYASISSNYAFSNSTQGLLLSVRKDADVSGGSMRGVGTVPIVNLTNFGRTLTIRDTFTEDAATGLWTYSLFPTTTNSRWGRIYYNNISFYGANAVSNLADIGPSMNEVVEFGNSTSGATYLNALTAVCFNTSAFKVSGNISNVPPSEVCIIQSATNGSDGFTATGKQTKFIYPVSGSYSTAPNATNLFSAKTYNFSMAYGSLAVNGYHSKRSVAYPGWISEDTPLGRGSIRNNFQTGYYQMLTRLPAFVTKKNSDFVFVWSSFSGSVASLDPTLPVPDARVAYARNLYWLSLCAQSLVSFKVKAGVTYRLRYSVTPRIYCDDVYYSGNDTHVNQAPTLSAYSSASSTSTWYIVPMLASASCFSYPLQVLGVESYPVASSVGPPFNSWVDVAYTFTPVSGGEVSLYMLHCCSQSSGFLMTLVDPPILEVV